MSENKMKCPNCGEIVYTRLEKDVETFDSILYNRRCMNCGHIIETVEVTK